MTIFLKVTLVGMVMSFIFNFILARLWLAYPAAVVNMLPKEIQALAPKADPKPLCKVRWSLFLLYLLILAIGLMTTALFHIRGFIPLFWIGYWQMFLVNLGDLIGLDWFFRKEYLRKLMIVGTEDCPTWKTKEWMMSLGLPEHLLFWPLIVCPTMGLIYQCVNFL